MQDSEQQREMAKSTFMKISDRLNAHIDKLKEDQQKNDQNLRILCTEKEALEHA